MFRDSWHAEEARKTAALIRKAFGYKCRAVSCKNSQSYVIIYEIGLTQDEKAAVEQLIQEHEIRINVAI